MPKLNEYIGSLVSSITNARVMSDMQTVKVAEEYAKHQFLQHFAVPRMRIDDIEMTIPIALDSLEPKEVRSYKIADEKKFNDVVFRELVKTLGFKRIPVKISRNLESEVARKSLDLGKQLHDSRTALTLFSKSITAYFYRTGESNSLIKKGHNADIRVVQKELEAKLSKEIVETSESNSLESLNVIVEAHRLKEQKPENLIYIKMKISEDGMEWHRMENNNGEIENRLLPE